MNVLKNLRDDLQVGIDQLIQRVRHHPFGRILDRHHAERRAPLRNLREHFGYAGRRAQIRPRAELLPRRQMSVGRLGAEERHFKGSFQRAAGGDDLSENRANGLDGQRTAVQLADAVENFFLAMGSVDLLLAPAL